MVAPGSERCLYLYRRGSNLWAANFLPALLAFQAIPIALDPIWLSATLIQRRFQDHPTPFSGVCKIAGGQMLCCDPLGEHRTRVWGPDPEREIRLSHDEDYVERTKELFEIAVRRRTQNGAQTSVLMTAGLDSSAVAVTAAKLYSDQTIQTYTAIPSDRFDGPVPGRRYRDEREGVAAIARLWPNIKTRLSNAEEPADFEFDPSPLFAASCLPHLAISNLGWLDPSYRAAQADGVDVLLTGQAGNLVVSDTGLGALLHMFTQGRWLSLAKLLPGLAAYRGITIAQLFRQEMISPSIPRRLHKAIRSSAGQPSWAGFSALSQSFASTHRLEERLWACGLAGDFSHHPNPRKQRANILSLCSWPAAPESIAFCRYGIEQRDPFADADLIDFCLAIPPEQYLAGIQTRSLARRCFADRLPTSVLHNHRVGAQCPEWYQRQKQMRPRYYEVLESIERIPLVQEMLDLRRMRSLLDAWPEYDTITDEVPLRYLVPRALHMGQYVQWVDTWRHYRSLTAHR
jgi:asparagine synthase (glutamine-hydrolysing)